MGNRYELTVTCPACNFVGHDVPFAPTCGFVHWVCPECDHTVDLVEETGITYEDASNADEINAIIDTFIAKAHTTHAD